MFGGIKDFVKIREQVDNEKLSITVPNGEIWRINMYVVFTDNEDQSTDMDAEVDLEIDGLTILNGNEIQSELGIEDYMVSGLYSVLNTYQKYFVSSDYLPDTDNKWVEPNVKRGIEGGIFLDEGEEIFIEENASNDFGFLIYGLAFVKE